MPAIGRDDAFVTVMIAAMLASGHASAEEGERAHNILWSTRLFRSRSGEAVAGRIERMRRLILQRGAAAVLGTAVPLIPPRLRQAVFAVAADIVLVDGRMERLESEFLRTLAEKLGLSAMTAQTIQDVIRTKNSV